MHSNFKQISLIVLIVLPAFFLTNCHSSRNISKGGAFKINAVEDFDAFYNKFHSDTVFQISRTKFPLGGKFVNIDEEKAWTRENLPLMRIRIHDVDTTQYQTSSNKTETTFTQKVWIEDSGFSSECRFELIKRKWYLVYALDENF